MAKIIVSLPDDLLKQLDLYRVLTSYNRSELIRHAIRTLLESKHEPKQPVQN